MSQEKILKKIKKCLALSKSSNANEAAAALRQAQALMLKYNVDLDDIKALDCNAAHIKIGKQPPLWQHYLARVCADAFGCEVVLQQAVCDGGRVVFIAPGIAPELSQYAFDVLLRQAKKDRADYIKTALYRCKRKNKTIRADAFCQAWVSMVARQVAAFSGRTKSNQESIDLYLQKKFPDLIKSKVKSRVSGSASDHDADAGRAAGKKASLNKGVNAKQRQKLESQ